MYAAQACLQEPATGSNEGPCGRPSLILRAVQPALAHAETSPAEANLPLKAMPDQKLLAEFLARIARSLT